MGWGGLGYSTVVVAGSLSSRLRGGKGMSSSTRGNCGKWGLDWDTCFPVGSSRGVGGTGQEGSMNSAYAVC